jgi:hypothetical protein
MPSNFSQKLANMPIMQEHRAKTILKAQGHFEDEPTKSQHLFAVIAAAPLGMIANAYAPPQSDFASCLLFASVVIPSYLAILVIGHAILNPSKKNIANKAKRNK